MRAWANRDLTTTKQKITSALNITTSPAPPPTPVQTPQHSALMAHNSPARVAPREMASIPSTQQSQLLQAMSNFTESLEAMALRNNNQQRQGFRGGCYCCGDPNHSFHQCDVLNNCLEQIKQLQR